MIEHRYGSQPPWSLGVEEELFLVDAETLETASLYSRVYGEPSERIKPELFECFVEIATTVLPDGDAVLESLVELRREAAARAAIHGATILAVGTHATASSRGQLIVPLPRYERMAKAFGDGVYNQLVCGLHVHVAVPDPAACLRAFEGIVPRLPSLLAASANSPYWEGEDTVWRSIRSQRLLELPTGGTPPVLRSWDDWEAASRGDSTRRHWDAWPRPEYGTLEVRVMDQPTEVRRSAELASLIQNLVREAAEEEHEPYDRELYSKERQAAARGGEPSAEAARQLELGPAEAVRDAVAGSLP